MKYLKKFFYQSRTSRRLITSALLLVLWSIPGAASAKPNVYGVFVDGIACPFCAYGIEKQLDKLNGVLEMKTDVAMGVIKLIVEESVTLTEEEVRDAVENAGFSLREFHHSDPE